MGGWVGGKRCQVAVMAKVFSNPDLSVFPLTAFPLPASELRAFSVWRAVSGYKACTCGWALGALKKGGRSSQVCMQAGQRVCALWLRMVVSWAFLQGLLATPFPLSLSELIH